MSDPEDRSATVAASAWFRRRSDTGAILHWRLLVVWDDEAGGFEVFVHHGRSKTGRPLRHHQGRQIRVEQGISAAVLVSQLERLIEAKRQIGFTGSASPGRFDAVDQETAEGWIREGRRIVAERRPRIPGRRVRGLADALTGARSVPSR